MCSSDLAERTARRHEDEHRPLHLLQAHQLAEEAVGPTEAVEPDLLAGVDIGEAEVARPRADQTVDDRGAIRGLFGAGGTPRDILNRIAATSGGEAFFPSGTGGRELSCGRDASCRRRRGDDNRKSDIRSHAPASHCVCRS